MKITRTLRVVSVASTVLAAVLLVAFVWALREFDRTQREEVRTRAIHAAIFDRLALRGDYMMSGEELTRRQWEAKTEEVSRMLGALQADGLPWERREVLHLKGTFARTTGIFRRIVENRQKPANTPMGRKYSAEFDRRLGRELLATAYTLAEAAERLLEASRRKADEARRRVVFIFFLLGGGGALFVLVGSRIINKRLLEGVTALSVRTEALAAGDLSARIDLRGNDEFTELGARFNAMADHLRASREELEAMNRDNESFSYSVAHDLRSPLRGIAGFTQVLRENLKGSITPDDEAMFERVQNAATRMGRIIDDLLLLAKVSRAEVRTVAVDLTAMANEVAAELSGRAPERVVAWRIEHGMTAIVDPTLVRVVLTNLMDNAFKFTAGVDAAKIVVRRNREDGPASFVVEDNGVGFDMAYSEKLFQPFQRLHGAEYPGTGIGLATVRRIVERHGGSIALSSSLGKGASARFTFEKEREDPC